MRFCISKHLVLGPHFKQHIMFETHYLKDYPVLPYCLIDKEGGFKKGYQACSSHTPISSANLERRPIITPYSLYYEQTSQVVHCCSKSMGNGLKWTHNPSVTICTCVKISKVLNGCLNECNVVIHVVTVVPSKFIIRGNFAPAIMRRWHIL